jgi:DNA invertase Pin-like site-specific DNA recombinase
MHEEDMIYRYARVSTDAQDLTNQVAQLKDAGCATIFREKIGGATADRPQLKKLMAKLTADDVVVIPAVDRLSRDTTDLLVIARDMQRAGAGQRSLAEPVVDTTSDFAELVLAMLGVAAKLERRRIVERTARGRADAKAKGVQFGRKPILTPHQQREARKRIEAGEKQRSVARSYNVNRATISRLLPLYKPTSRPGRRPIRRWGDVCEGQNCVVRSGNHAGEALTSAVSS